MFKALDEGFAECNSLQSTLGKRELANSFLPSVFFHTLDKSLLRVISDSELFK
jgi:hypothetical protein